MAAYRLGTLYERGHGVPADKAKAMHWYTVAANAGNRKAMHNLAVAYAEGSGVKKDYAQRRQLVHQGREPRARRLPVQSRGAL